MSEPVDRVALDSLLAMFNGDKAFLYQVIDTYLSDGVRLLASVQQALTDGNADDLRRAAHSLKSNSANLGAMALSQQSRELEDLGRQGTLTDAPAKTASLTEEFQRVKVALEKIRTEGL
jgi:HPt (histidine-containing phosphotransfer) domain-containing protein